MKYIYRTFYYLFKAICFVFELTIWLLSFGYDFVVQAKDWFNKKEKIR
tara:strand:+ start:942 stop:1085 length:144 start_codon:yes stop_codon:yes gene_type:complete